MKKLSIKLSLFVLLAAIAGCASGGNMAAETSEMSRNLTLKEHLMRKGVTVSGTGATTMVYIRQMGREGRQPLFVVDGNAVGRSFPAATSLVTPEEIAEVEVYTPAQAARWGGRGAYGVIVITTKSANNE